MAEINTSLRLLRELQADMRTLRSELKPMRENYVTREEIYRMVTIIGERFAEFEAHMDTRIDALEALLALSRVGWKPRKGATHMREDKHLPVLIGDPMASIDWQKSDEAALSCHEWQHGSHIDSLPKQNDKEQHSPKEN